jgi:hypothetical protein
MSIRLDPRRLGLLKQLAAEQDLRPGDLVRSWVEERIDGERLGSPVAPTVGVSAQLEALVARIAALEAAAGIAAPAAPGPAAPPQPATEPASVDEAPTAGEPESSATTTAVHDEVAATDADTSEATSTKRPRAKKRVATAPAGERVALHDEMIAVITERGPMTAGELAAVITERGRYAPPRSGKALDAAMVSQRVSNPAYRGRFTRDAGRIGLAE